MKKIFYSSLLALAICTSLCIANLANLYYIPFAPHMVASFLGAMACAHVCDRCRMTYFGELIYEDT